MLGLRLALGAIALMAVMTASIGGLAVIDSNEDEATVAFELRLGGVGPYWDAVAEGAKAAAARCGVSLAVQRNGLASQEGHATLTNLGTGGSASCGGVGNSSPHMFHVGMANYSAGRICANFAAETVAAGSKIVVLVDRSAKPTFATRLQGFCDMLRRYAINDRSEYELQIEDMPTARVVISLEQRRRRLERVAARHGDAAIVIDFTDGSASTLWRAFADGSEAGTTRLVTFDQSEAALAAIETGQLAAVIAHDPYQCGYLAVDRLALYQRGGPLAQPAAGKGYVNLPPQLVRRGNLAEFRSSLKFAAASP